MKGIATVCMFLLAASTTLVPSVAADHQPCVGHTEGAQTRAEIAGAGLVSVGTYSEGRERWRADVDPDGDSCARPSCDAFVNGVVVPELGTPTLGTPDVRLMGQTVVREQSVPGTTVLPSFTVPVTIPSLFPACVADNVGVYARVAGVATVGAGTEEIPGLSWSALP